MWFSISVSLIIVFVGCSRTDVNTSPDLKPDANRRTDAANESLVLKFDELLRRIETINRSELAFFKANWPSLRAELEGYVADGQLSKLSFANQEQIYMELSYLERCYHPDVMRTHGKEILEIVKHLKVSDEFKQHLESPNDQKP